MVKMNLEIINGDVLDGLSEIGDSEIDLIITSPPYWSLRDYGNPKQIGQEQLLKDYLNNLLDVSGQLHRVLKKTGVMYWNHGDGYAGANRGTNKKGEFLVKSKVQKKYKASFVKPPNWKLNKYPKKSLLMQNYRLIINMVDLQGWRLRNILVWHKKNPAPESVRDRYRRTYEPIFLLSKSEKYYFNMDPIRKPYAKTSKKRFKYAVHSSKDHNYTSNKYYVSEKGKIPGDIITTATSNFKGFHSATFPEKLIEPFIISSCPKGGTVLDPFMGRGTVLKVARKHGCNAIGIELNPEYVEIAKKYIGWSKKEWLDVKYDVKKL